MRVFRPVLVAAVAVALTGLSAAATSATSAEPAPTAHPRAAFRAEATHPQPESRFLPRLTEGKAALKALGGRIDEAATLNELSTKRFRAILATDDTARVLPSGRLAYADTFAASPTSTPSPAPRSTAALTLADTFTLHSRPGSDHTIFLDFDGANVSSTAWNQGADAIPNKTYTGFSLDGSASFTNSEKTYIQEVWAYVAEIYSVFDVDVTTDTSTPASRYNRSSASDTTYGDHVVFSDDAASFPICDPSEGCAGIALVGGFDDPDDNDNFYEPAWVRTKDFKAASFDSFETAMAASHEIGHTLGLDHDAQTAHDGEEATDYYEGAGSWSPIMGSGIHAIQQFSDGDYAYANNQEDDFAVMVDHGLPKVADEAGSTLATAATLGSQTSYDVPGVITSRTDVDAYKFGPCATQPTVTANGTGLGSALDLKLSLFDQNQDADGVSDPATGAADPHPNSGLDAGPLTGTGGPAEYYYATIDGVGWGNPLTTGYSDYGSVGSYTLHISDCAAFDSAAPGAPTSVTLTNNRSAGTLTWVTPSSAGDTPISGYRITGLPGGAVEVSASTHSYPLTVKGGVVYALQVAAMNAAGAGPTGKNAATPTQTWAPTAVPTVTVSNTANKLAMDWVAPANPGNATLDHWRFQIVGAVDENVGTQYTGLTYTGVPYDTYTIKVTPAYTADQGTAPTKTISYTVSWKPNAPKIGKASSGAKGGTKSATARWSAAVNNKSAIKTYKVYASKLSSTGKVTKTYTSPALKASARSYAFKLPAGTYKFRVLATNARGSSPLSGYSAKVTAR